ncbi:AsmA family protein, partial [bacterium]
LNGSLNLAEVGQYYPLEPGTELAGRMSANVNVAGKVKEPAAMKGSGPMEFQGVSIKTPASANPVKNLAGAITFNNQLVEAKKLSMNLGKSDLTLAFALRNYLSLMSEDKSLPRPTAKLTLNSNHLYTADVMPSDKQQPKGATKDTVAAKQPQSGVPLPNVDMDINATIGTLTMEKFEFKNVRGAMKIADGVINMQNFSLNAFGGSAVSKGSLNLKDPKRPLFDLALDINGVESHSLLPHFTSFGQRVNGKMTMNTTMKGALNDTLGLVPPALNGQGRVQITDGVLTGVKVNQAIATLLKLPDLETIKFKDWANSFTIAEGRIIIKDLKIHALDADYTVNGSQGLDGSLDYVMTMLLSQTTSGKVNLPGFAGQAADLFKDETGRLKLDFAVGGTSDDPKVSLDTKSAQQKAETLAKKKLEDEAKKATDQLKKKAEDALKGIFKKK